MNDYEARRQERIKQNQALLAQLDIKPLIKDATKSQAQKQKTKSRASTSATARQSQKFTSAPARTSARIAASAPKNYSEDKSALASQQLSNDRTSSSTRRVPKRKHNRITSSPNGLEEGSIASREPSTTPEPTIPPPPDIAAMQTNWTNWKATGAPPIRNAETGSYHFPDAPLFEPNLSPETMLREGAFGGSYYRPLRSRKLGITIQDDWTELPSQWLADLNIDKYLTSPTYDPEINKFGVACGQSIEEWEAAGWIAHEFDVRGWFQWYVRFWLGRRCEDDERQISRWRKCVGPTGRWRRMLLKKYLQLRVREVWDYGDQEEVDTQVSPVMHQTCHHWAFEVRQQHLDLAWAEAGG